jgi:hypothetical protein
MRRNVRGGIRAIVIIWKAGSNYIESFYPSKTIAVRIISDFFKLRMG